VRRIFERYATGRFTKQQVLEKATALGLAQSPKSAAQFTGDRQVPAQWAYMGVIDVPEFGVRGKRGDFERIDRPQAHARSLSQVSTGKLDARSRFQVLLKRDCSALIRELHDDINDPRPMFRRVKTATGVVGVETGSEVGG
jgi:hypothetical protein